MSAQPPTAVIELPTDEDDITPAAKRQATGPLSESSRSQQYQRTLSAREERRLEQNRVRARETRKRDKAKWQQMQKIIVSLTRENEQLKRRNELLSSELTLVSQGLVSQQTIQSVPQVVGAHSLTLSGGSVPSFAVRQQPAISVAALHQPSLNVASPKQPVLGLQTVHPHQPSLGSRQSDAAQVQLLDPETMSASRAELLRVAGVNPVNPLSAVGPLDLEIMRQQQYGQTHPPAGLPVCLSGLSGSDIRRALG
uniref:BZIP domain-containing protein n=1 Tax=Trieres chinensis TaxID=1514140 RepID=A0A7S2AA95_TRICV